jgi:hypothetical protein
MMTLMRKFGAESFEEVHHHEDDVCVFCEAARQLFIEWPAEGYAVAFIENEKGTVRRIEGSKVDGINVFCCVEVTTDEARAEIAESAES